MYAKIKQKWWIGKFLDEKFCSYDWVNQVIMWDSIKWVKEKSHLCHSDKNNKKYFFCIHYQNNFGGTGQLLHYTIGIFMAVYSNYRGIILENSCYSTNSLIQGPPFSAEIEVLKNMTCYYCRNFPIPIILWKIHPKLYRKQIICKFFWQEILFIKENKERDRYAVCPEW